MKETFEPLLSRTLHGRLNRKRYFLWNVYAILGILAFGMAAGFVLDTFHGGKQGFYLALLLMNIIGNIFFLLLDTGRLHDLGYSGWIALIYMGILVAMNGWSLWSMPTVSDEDFAVSFGMTLLRLVVSLIFLCKKGTAGPNRYGEDPLRERKPTSWSWRHPGEALKMCAALVWRSTACGRLGRLRFFEWTLIWNLLFTACMAAYAAVAPNAEIINAWVFGILFCLLPIGNAFLMAGRLHDLNRTAWWIGLFYVVQFWGLLISLSLSDGERIGDVIKPFLLLVYLYLLFRRGTAGPNRFGEDPLAEE